MKAITGGMPLPPGMKFNMKSTEIDLSLQLLSNLPGIGPRSARRIILHLIKIIII